jgi:TPP-dependent pyruvate/acetoin dehydrogenase alpha subunit
LRLRSYLEGRGLIDEATEAEMREAIGAEIGAAVESMEAQSLTNVGQLFENVYAEPTPRLRAQRAEVEGGEG